jgi:hypothetical protein
VCRRAAAAKIDDSEKHRSATRNTPLPRAFHCTDGKEFPIPYSKNQLAEVLGRVLKQPAR